MLHTTLSKGKQIAQRKKERYIKVQVKRTGRHIIRAQKKEKEISQTHVKDRATNHLYVLTSPGQWIGYTT